MTVLRISRLEDSVYLINEDHGASLRLSGWERADAFGHALQRAGRHMTFEPRPLTRTSIRLSDRGEIVVVWQDRMIVVMPPDVAVDVANGIIAKAREIEQDAKAESTAFDQAFLLRSGRLAILAPTRDIQEEAARLSYWDERLRRWFPSSPKNDQQLTLSVRRGGNDGQG